MNRLKISRELFMLLQTELICHDVENAHLGPMGATYKDTYKCADGFIVYEIGGMGGCDYYIEATK